MKNIVFLFLLCSSLAFGQNKITLQLPTGSGGSSTDTTSLSNRINSKQDGDADLTSIAAISGTNTIPYRSASNTWGSVTIGSGLTFSGGTLSASGGGLNYTVQTLTDGSTITWNTASGINAQVTLTSTGRTLAMSNLTAGYTYTLRVIQDGTGSRTLTTWPSGTKWPFAGAVPAQSSGANQYDLYTLYYDGTNLYATQMPNLQ